MSEMKTILITNDTGLAADAQAAGVTRVMVDLESHGKKERQAGRATFISTHAREDVPRLRGVLKTSQLLVRINPWHSGSAEEMEYALGEGADLVMLPMITSLRHLEAFVNQIGTRAQPVPLIETAYSMAHTGDIAALETVREVYIGLNDLHLSLGLDFLFEPLALGLVEWMAAQVTAQGKSFGFGGIAMMNGGAELPAERILAEHVRLGSGCVILSSRFCRDVGSENPEGRRQRMAAALAAMHATHRRLSRREPPEQREDAGRTAAVIRSLADRVRLRGAAS